MISLEIRPFEGAAPIYFGILRSRVHELLGAPDVVRRGVDRWRSREIDVGYDHQGMVYEVRLVPGKYELSLGEQLIWSPNEHPDPNPMFLTFDPEPLECVGFLVFTKIGVATSGFYDDDPYQLALQVFRKGAWDDLLSDAKQPVLDKYKSLNGST